MVGSCRRDAGPVRVDRVGVIEYVAAWDAQRAHAEARRTGAGLDVLMLLEHPSVYTAGKRTQPEDRPTDGTPVIDVDRGGRITWHGPGQLVGYPIVALAEPLDVVDFVRRLEEALIAVVHELGITAAGRVDGRTGVWLPADDRGPERKIAAIGVRVQGGITLHGFALNCEPDLAFFGQKDAAQVAIIRRMVRDLDFPVGIVPCPTMREPDGLAMSSRNSYLSPQQRKDSLVLSRSLTEINRLFEGGERSVQKLIAAGAKAFRDGARLDYVEIVDPDSLVAIDKFDKPALVAVAAFIAHEQYHFPVVRRPGW
jgi:lipoate-protein ligase B